MAVYRKEVSPGDLPTQALQIRPRLQTLTTGPYYRYTAAAETVSEEFLSMAENGNGRRVVPKETDNIIICKCLPTKENRCTSKPDCTCMRRGATCNSSCTCGNNCSNHSTIST